MPINLGKTRPWVLFLGYITAVCFAVLLFRLIFPGEPPPLPIFSRNWRLLQGVLDIINFFPAIAFSALILPFGQASDIVYHKRFSPQLFQRLLPSIVMAICAAAVYAVLFLAFLPLAQDAQENMRFRAEIHRYAAERAQNHAQAGEWIAASRYIAISRNVWRDSPEIERLRFDVEIGVEDLRIAEADARRERVAAGFAAERTASLSNLPGQREPVDAAEAIAMAQSAFNERRHFDAHWLATLAGRLAPAGSVEIAEAARLASLAWNEIESQRPGWSEIARHEFFRTKMSGYEAMLSGDWIRAYYIFLELNERVPGNPDVENFLEASRRGAMEVAFFADEVRMLLNTTFTGAIFSLPDATLGRNRGGRSVMRIDGFSYAADYAFGIGLEYMVFDSQSRLLFSLRSPYAKFLPIVVNGHQQVLILMRALDRHDPYMRWEPVWDVRDPSFYYPGQAQIILDISYEKLLTLSQMRRDLSAMRIDELFAASNIAGDFGYTPRVFEAEILNRLGSAFFFLPMAILVIVLGLRLQTRSRPRYIYVIMLGVLPLVFSVVVYVWRSVFNIVGTSLILAASFPVALALFIVIMILSFIFSLILLSSYKD